jgi:hypothetical protein
MKLSGCGTLGAIKQGNYQRLMELCQKDNLKEKNFKRIMTTTVFNTSNI